MSGRTWPSPPPPPPAGTEECERALVDFMAFQDITSRKLLRLQQALPGAGARTARLRREGRAALQRKLWQQLSELREAQPGGLLGRLLSALRVARLPRLEHLVRQRFLQAR